MTERSYQRDKIPSDAEPLNSIITCSLPLGSRSTCTIFINYNTSEIQMKNTDIYSIFT